MTRLSLKFGMLSTALFAVSSCSDSFMKSTARSKTSNLTNLSTSLDAAGNVSASLDPNSTSTQVLRITSGSLAGAGVAFPPGSLSGALSVTIGEGENLASSSFTQSLGITDNSVTAAGPSISFASSSEVEASSPFTLSIPTSTTTLALASIKSENLVVMYRWTKVTDGVASYVAGIIPRSDVVVGATTVAVSTTKFGVFQLAISANKITERVSVPTADPPAQKMDANNPLVGTFGQCHPENWNPGGGGTGSAPTKPIMDWKAANNFASASGATDCGVSIGMYIDTNIAAGMSASVLVSIDGLPPQPTYSTSVSGTNTSVSVFSMTSSAPTGKVLTLWAPNKCHFHKSIAPIGDFYSIPLFYLQGGSGTISGSAGYCSVQTTGLSFVCDGVARKGDAPPWFDQQVDKYNADVAAAANSQTGGGGGGGDSYGRVPGITYSSFDIGKFTANSFTHIRQTFKSSDCTGELASTLIETGSYELLKVDVAGTIPINFKKSTKVGTILDPDGVNFANNHPRENCGFNDWAKGTQKDLVKSSCSSPNPIEYTRVKIDGKKLYFCDHGKDSNANYGNSAANRAPHCNDIEPTDFLTRQ